MKKGKTGRGEPSRKLKLSEIQKHSYSISTWRALSHVLLHFSHAAELSDSEPDGLATVERFTDGTWKLELTLRSFHRSGLQHKLRSVPTCDAKR